MINGTDIRAAGFHHKNVLFREKRFNYNLKDGRSVQSLRPKHCVFLAVRVAPMC